MAAFISIAVAYVGVAVGTAIAGALVTAGIVGGTILGISTAIIGGVIGAGIAGGLLSMARGGDFGKGFLMGSVSAGIGAFINTGFSGGATQFADGTTSASMLAAQGGAEFAPEAFSGMGDVSGAVADAGMGDFPPSNYGAVGEVNPNGVTTYGLGETMSPTGTELGAMPTDLASMEASLQAGINADFSSGTGVNPSLATSAGYGGDAYSMIPADSQSAYAPPTASAATGPQTLEGVVSQQPGGATIGADGTTSADMFRSQGGAEFAPNNAPQSSPSSGLGGMFKTGDAWLKNNMGMQSGASGKLLMGGVDALMKNYQTNKLERQAQGMAPMSFEEYQAKFGNTNVDTDNYKVAANQMGKAGRTGTLPVLLARMQERARAAAREGYGRYLPGAQKDQFDRQAGFAKARTGALQNLFTPAYAGAQ